MPGFHSWADDTLLQLWVLDSSQPGNSAFALQHQEPLLCSSAPAAHSMPGLLRCRAQAQAAEKGESVAGLVAERWGSLTNLTDGLSSRHAAHRMHPHCSNEIRFFIGIFGISTSSRFCSCCSCLQWYRHCGNCPRCCRCWVTARPRGQQCDCAAAVEDVLLACTDQSWAFWL